MKGESKNEATLLPTLRGRSSGYGTHWWSVTAELRRGKCGNKHARYSELPDIRNTWTTDTGRNSHDTFNESGYRHIRDDDNARIHSLCRRMVQYWYDGYH